MVLEDFCLMINACQELDHFHMQLDGTYNVPFASAILRKEKSNHIMWDADVITLTGIILGTDTSVSSYFIETRSPILAGI